MIADRGSPHTGQHVVVASLLAVTTLLVAPGVRAQSVCTTLAGQRDATIIAYEPPSSFTICRAGQVEADVVEGRPVYVQLVAKPGAGLLRFHVHGRATSAEPTGLLASAARIEQLSNGLRALASSAQRIEDSSGPGAPVSAIDQSRALYLGTATSRFHDGLTAVAQPLDRLAAEATMLARVCTALGPGFDPSPPVAAELAQRCGDPRTAPASVEKEVATMLARIDAFRVARDGAREALVAARAKPDDATATTRAVASLDQARRGANDVIDQARRLTPLAASLASEAALLREALRDSVGTLVAGVPFYLTRFSRGGMASLTIDSEPIDLLPAAAESAKAPATGETSSETFRFPVVGLHFVDIEAGVGATGGPLVPSVGPGGVIGGSNIDEFVGLAMVEIEPARFFWPDHPLAGLFRFPVIGVPFTRDPTRNFFGGAGLGWTGVGSLSAGPYLYRGLALDSGYSVGQTIGSAQSLDSIASPQLRVGYFVSASIDLIGLAHLFFTPRETQLDATTGSEMR